MLGVNCSKTLLQVSYCIISYCIVLVLLVGHRASFRGFKSGLGLGVQGNMFLDLLVGSLYNAR